MGKLTKRQVNLANKTDTQLKIIEDYFFARRFFAKLKITDRHYCDLVLERKNEYHCLKKAIEKLSLSNIELDIMEPIESLQFCYDGDYLFRNGNSSKAKYSCLFLGPKQIFAYTYTFDMTSSNFTECATELFYNSITGISTEEKVNDREVALHGFIGPTGKRSIHTVESLKLFTSGGVFEYSFAKTPDTEKQLADLREKIRAFRTIKLKRHIEDLPIE